MRNIAGNTQYVKVNTPSSQARRLYGGSVVFGAVIEHSQSIVTG